MTLVNRNWALTALLMGGSLATHDSVSKPRISKGPKGSDPFERRR
jgi:hypothetical protein